MKQFTITKIQTRGSGEVILSGKKGMIRIIRGNARFSTACYHPGLNGIAERDEVHSLSISEIRVPKKGKALFTETKFWRKG